jgi:hypothetical protein
MLPIAILGLNLLSTNPFAICFIVVYSSCLFSGLNRSTLLSDIYLIYGSTAIKMDSLSSFGISSFIFFINDSASAELSYNYFSNAVIYS